MSGDKRNQSKKLAEVLEFLKDEYDIAPSQVLRLIKEKKKQQREQGSQYIPVSLFTATPLSSLEAITVYLRETKRHTFVEMESLLGRNQIALATSYRNAKKKDAKQLILQTSKYQIPCSTLKNSELSVLETICFYLKKEYLLSNNEIAKLLNKDPRTIWTVLARAKKKGVKL